MAYDLKIIYNGMTKQQNYNHNMGVRYDIYRIWIWQSGF